ncbi:MAG: YceD family protein [Sphingopyxis sp.]
MAEFVRPFTLADLRRRPMALTITADDAECAAVAQRFSLVALNRLVADVSLVFDGDSLSVTGALAADVVQQCVATGEPLPAAITADIAVRYVPMDKLEAAEAEAEVELDGADLDVIGYASGRVDLADMVADTLYLALDPFPRSANADEWLAANGVKTEGEAGAFGALAALRDRMAGGA